jgi:hypothetical protein
MLEVGVRQLEMMVDIPGLASSLGRSLTLIASDGCCFERWIRMRENHEVENNGKVSCAVCIVC